LTKKIFALALSTVTTAMLSLMAPLTVAAQEYKIGHLNSETSTVASAISSRISPVSESLLLGAGIHNFDKVTDHVWRGALPSDHAIEKMSNSGINTIIDLRMNGEGTEHEEKLAASLGMHYLHIPMGFTQPSDEQINTCLQTVLSPSSGAVFVHCRQGADRTGTMCAIYRRLVDRISFDEAYIEMRRHHFKPFLAGMKKCVQEFPYEQYRNHMNDKTAEQASSAGKFSANG
jgi:protein tyrosine phosphatase (PTP) superfamily phosphohydrolase (DUF442 family)